MENEVFSEQLVEIEMLCVSLFWTVQCKIEKAKKWE